MWITMWTTSQCYHKLLKDPTPTQESKISRKLKPLNNVVQGNNNKALQQTRPSSSQSLGYMTYPNFTSDLSLSSPLFWSPSYQLSKYIATIILLLAKKIAPSFELTTNSSIAILPYKLFPELILPKSHFHVVMCSFTSYANCIGTCLY